MQAGPDGTLRPARVRRRFPHLGMVALFYAVSGPLVCAGVSWLLHAAFGNAYLRLATGSSPLPPAPSWNNVLFGAGPQEIAVASCLIGTYLWHLLWNTRLPKSDHDVGLLGTLPPLLLRSLFLGPLLAFAAMPIGIFGLYIRTAPADQPWVVRPFFAFLAILPLMFSSMLTLVVPVVVGCLGLLLGMVTAAGVAYLWRDFPEEPVLK